MPGFGGDLVGVITLLLTIWGLIAVLQSGADGMTKLIWVLILILLPLIGFLIWYFIGPGSKAFPGRG